MRVLVLGGTVFLGRHVVEQALERGHAVTLVNRGRTGPDLYPDAEHLRGDRDGDLSVLAGGTWDAAVDTSARLPRWVRSAGEILSAAVEHYTFVSSISVYAEPMAVGTDETAPVIELVDESVEEVTNETYGGLKVLCERAAADAFHGRALVVRAGLLVGPYDDTGRFTYWVHRVARGGDVLVPEPRDQPVQLVDARDLAAWILDMAETGSTGTFNATGPAEPLTMAGLVHEIAAATGSNAHLVWVPEDFLAEHGVEMWSDLPLWLAPKRHPELDGFLAVDVGRALAAELRFRPLAETIRDTLAGAATTADAGLAAEREHALLAAWAARVAA